MSHPITGSRTALVLVTVLLVAWCPSVARAGDGEVSAVRPGADLAAASAELEELTAMLDAWTSRDGWPFFERDSLLAYAVLPDDPCPAISSRLALFATRFGVSYRDMPGFDVLAALAVGIEARLLAARSEAGAGEESALDESWCYPGWLGVRALLLELSGRIDDAHALLFGDGPRWWTCCCPYHEWEGLFAVTRARADFLDRTGEREQALLWAHATYFYHAIDLIGPEMGHPRAALDLFLARYAELLADAGETDAARRVVAELRRDHAGSLGLAIASPPPPWPGPPFLVERDVALVDDPSGPAILGIDLRKSGSGPHGWNGTALLAGKEDDGAHWRLLGGIVSTDPENEQGWDGPCYADYVVVGPDDPRVATFLARAKAEQRARDARTRGH
ncbi:MAG: hypothetical protein H6825_00365 [Planctomycetes bacterium]|nr:hypothetical protein [Planctomycetota bacterium]